MRRSATFPTRTWRWRSWRGFGGRTASRSAHGAAVCGIGIRANVELGAIVYTDTLRSYSGLDADYVHETVDHAEKYAEGKIHINGMENFWSLLKRGLHGTYIHAAPFHLFRYLDERMFTFNERDLDDLGRFIGVVSTVAGRRITYAKLTGKPAISFRPS